MSHAVENMFYVGREKPWHGLGVSVESAPTSADAIRLAGLDWTVKQSPVYTEQGFEIPGYRANIRDIDNTVLGMVGDRYKVVQNKDAFDFTDAMLGEGVKYETAGSLFNGKRIWLLANMPKTQILGDDVIPYMCFTNGHDGYHSIKVCCCNVRVVCNNTLNLAFKQASRCWSTRHVGDLSSKMQEARRCLNLAEKYNEALAEFAYRAANTTITEEEQENIVKKLFPIDEAATDRTKQNIEADRQDFRNCIVAVDLSKFYLTAWGLINAASDYVYHKNPRRKTSSLQDKRMETALEGSTLLDTCVSLCNVPN